MRDLPRALSKFELQAIGTCCLLGAAYRPLLSDMNGSGGDGRGNSQCFVLTSNTTFVPLTFLNST